MDDDLKYIRQLERESAEAEAENKGLIPYSILTIILGAIFTYFWGAKAAILMIVAFFLGRESKH